MKLHLLIAALQEFVSMNPQYKDEEVFDSYTRTKIEGYGTGELGFMLSAERPTCTPSDQGSWDYYSSFFKLANIKINRYFETLNQYHNRTDAIYSLKNPYWVVITNAGPVLIGWRKRVITIHWEGTPIRRIINTDETTKEETMVHAWGEAKALEYLKELAHELNTLPAPTK